MAANKKEIVSVKNIRNVNIENLLQSILQSRTVTRNVLAKENDVSLMTVKHIVDQLIDRGILVERESSNPDVGRNPKLLEIAEKYGNILCVNLTSRDEIRFLIYDIYENLLEEQSVILDEEHSYRKGLLEAIERIQKSLDAIPSTTVGAALFVPSAYDEALDQVNYDLIPDFKDLHIRTLFEEKLQLTNVQVVHDVFAAARSEYDNLDSKVESQFYFYCGYGVGGCFIHKDEPVGGTKNMAGEVGKMLVSMEGDKKNYKILEDVVSISAVKKMMNERKWDFRVSDCVEGSAEQFERLLELYQTGHKEAVQFLIPVLDTICRLLYNLLWVYNPAWIVIDSCSPEYGKVITEYFQIFLEHMTNDAIPIQVQIRQAKYDEYHRMRGCFYMVRNAWIEKIAQREM